MLKVLLTLSLFILTLFLSLNCSKSNAELQGSVFIVTNGAQNIKLGLVKITAIPESEIIKFVEQKKSFISDESNKLKGDIDAAKPEIDKYQKEYDEAKRTYDAINSQRENLKSREQSLNSNYNPYSLYESPYLSEYETDEEKATRSKQKQIKNQLEGLKKQIAAYDQKVSQANKIVSDAQQKLSNSKAKITKINEKLLSYLNQSYLLEGLPEGKIKAVTDADGKFSMKLPTGKYALVASSQRRVVDSTEEYYWLVWVNLDGQEAKQIMLSNQNMLGQDSEDSVFNYKELVPLLDNSTDKNSNIIKSQI